MEIEPYGTGRSNKKGLPTVNNNSLDNDAANIAPTKSKTNNFNITAPQINQALHENITDTMIEPLQIDRVLYETQIHQNKYNRLLNEIKTDDIIGQLQFDKIRQKSKIDGIIEDNAGNNITVLSKDATNMEDDRRTDQQSAGLHRAQSIPFLNHTFVPDIVDRTRIRELDPEAQQFEINNLRELEEYIMENNLNKVKKILRKSNWAVFSPMRSRLWSTLCRQHEKNLNLNCSFYYEIVKHIFGTNALQENLYKWPDFVVHPILSYHLTDKGLKLASRLLNVLNFEYPILSYCPELQPIVSLLLHYMPEEEAYLCATTLVCDNNKKFLRPSRLTYEISGQLVFQMSVKYVQRAIEYIRNICPHLNLYHLFDKWQLWIFNGLPFHHLVRIIDCYLHEGIKVLYRVAFVILDQFFQECTGNKDLDSNLIAKDINMAIILHCRRLTLTPSALMSKAFSIRGLSSAYIERERVIAERMVKNRITHLPILPAEPQYNILSIPYSLLLKDYVNARSWQNILYTLFKWLPVKVSLLEPVILYSTRKHERSLKTLYKLVGKTSPTMMIIETHTSEVFGVYNAMPYTPSEDDPCQLPIYNCTNETFIFSLFPKRIKYSWIDLEKYEDPISQIPGKQITKKDTSRGDALWLDEFLIFGKSKYCRAFSSPSLCARGEFAIRTIDVFRFLSSQEATAIGRIEMH